MYRDRTNLFLSYRRTFPHQRKFNKVSNNHFTDFENGSGLYDEEAYPMVEITSNDCWPPNLLDMIADIDDNLLNIDTQLIALTKLYKKTSLPGFEDNSKDEKEIENISCKIIKNIQYCFSRVKILQSSEKNQEFYGYKLNKSNVIIIQNLQKSYASKIQITSNKFRVLQNNYLNFLNKDNYKLLPVAQDDKQTSIMLQENKTLQEHMDIELYSKETLQKQFQKQQLNTKLLQERDKEITQLASGVLEVSTIFREMQSLIINQGTIIDRIDYNLQNTVIELKSGQKELDRAIHYQKKTQKCKIMLLLSICIIILGVVVILKPHNKTVTEINKNNYDGNS